MSIKSIKIIMLLGFIVISTKSFSQISFQNTSDIISIDSIENNIQKIEEKVFTNNTSELLPEIENVILNCEKYYKTTKELSNWHIFSYLLYAIHKLELNHINADEVNLALKACNKAISLLKSNKVSESNVAYIYAENIKIWCHHFLSDYDSPYKKYGFTQWTPIFLDDNIIYNYSIHYNDEKYKPSLLTQLYNSAEELQKKNLHTDALIYLFTAKELYDLVFEEKKDFYYEIINKISISYGELKNNELAIKYLNEYIEYYDKDKGMHADHFITIASDYNEHYKKEAEFGKQILLDATKYYKENNIKKLERQLNLIKRYFGSNSIMYEENLRYIAELYGFEVLDNLLDKKCRNVKKAEINASKYLKQSIDAIRNYIHSHFPLLPYEDRYLFSNKRLAWIEKELPVLTLISAHNKDAHEAIYNAQLLIKGLYLNTEREMNRSIKVDTIQDKWKKVIYASNTNYMDFINYTWKDIARKMENDMIAIEFINFRNLFKEEVYAACIIRNDSKYPEFIPIFHKNKFDNIANVNYYTSDALYNIIWKKIEPYLKSNDKIYFSPSGLLNKICIESLRDSLGVMASDKWQLYRVSSTREILNINNSKIKKPTAILYGWINYDQITQDSLLFTYEFQDESEEARELLRGNLVKNLPYTKYELENIKEILKNHSVTHRTYEREIATEESFKTQSGKLRSIIHLATHGFYWETNNMSDYYKINNRDSILSTLDESMKRSGLLFSGANKTLNGNLNISNQNDGILTAYEISKLNLQGCDLVVLSACETGLGDIYNSEGVYGLQRGFKMAGVNSILMSLWKVDDRATHMLMGEFYRHYLNGKSKIESLKLAQKYVADHPGYSDPLYWAGFVLLDALN